MSNIIKFKPPAISCDEFIKRFHTDKAGSVIEHLYLQHLLNIDPVFVAKGEDYYFPSQHHAAYEAVMREIGGEA